MMYTCAPSSAVSQSGHRKLVKRGGKTLAGDLHCHVQTPAADDLARQTAVPASDPLDLV